MISHILLASVHVKGNTIPLPIPIVISFVVGVLVGRRIR